MKNKFFIAFLIFINFSFAQNKYDFEQFVNESGDYFKAPLDWQGKDFLFFGLTAGATIAAMQFDNDLKDFTQNNRTGNPPIYILAGRLYGEPVIPALLGSFLIIHGNSTGNDVNKKIGFEIAQAAFYAFSTTQLLKILFGRERPATTENNKNFTIFNLSGNDFWSLPSGHTTMAFALSTVLSENTDSDLLRILSFVPSVLTAYSRIYENRHWFSDVVLGGVIGYTSAKFFTNKHGSKTEIINPEPVTLLNFSLPLN